MQVEFSTEDVTFSYADKKHLSATLTIRNQSDNNVYFKFKLTRPKFYLLKPDRGFVESKQSVNIDITLHQEGVNDGESDKLKCFYRAVGKSKAEPTAGWEKDELETYSLRLPIVINGLPAEYRRHDEAVKSSEVKSMAHSKFDSGKSSQSTIENSIREKEGKMTTLRNQIDNLRRSRNSSPSKLGLSWQYFAAGGAALILGLISSIWI